MNRIKNSNNIFNFYKNVLCAWGNIVDCAIPRSGYLWYNRNILIHGKSVYYPDFHNSGINYLSDLFDNNGQIIPFEELVSKGLDKEKWLQWYGLIHSIKSKWVHKRTFIQSENSNGISTAFFVIGGKGLEKVPAIDIYKYAIYKSLGLRYTFQGYPCF